MIRLNCVVNNRMVGDCNRYPRTPSNSEISSFGSWRDAT